MRIWDDITLPEVSLAEKHLDIIAYRIASKHGVSIRQIKNGCRKHYLVNARQEIALELYYEEGLTYSEIGRYMKRHHTTILNYISGRPTTQ